MKNTFVLTISSATVAIVLLACSLPILADTVQSERHRMQSALMWGIIPGGGHFYLDETKAGITYAGTMLSLIGAGIWLDERNRELEHHDEVNTYRLLAIKEWELSLFTTYRRALRSEGYDLRSMGVDDTSVGKLFLSPFRKEYYSDPMVILAGLMGIAVAVHDSRNSGNSFADVRRVGILGADANQEWGLGLYGIDAFGLSLAAGVSEEAIWRGLIQNEMEVTFGKRWGLWSAATLFGAAHVVNLDGELSGYRVLVATIAGLYLGHLYQKREHRLGRAIAAHFWYNFAAMMASFALDPENNPLGVRVSFEF
jgi:hypothetical protein